MEAQGQRHATSGHCHHGLLGELGRSEEQQDGLQCRQCRQGEQLVGVKALVDRLGDVLSQRSRTGAGEVSRYKTDRPEQERRRVGLLIEVPFLNKRPVRRNRGEVSFKPLSDTNKGPFYA